MLIEKSEPETNETEFILLKATSLLRNIHSVIINQVDDLSISFDKFTMTWKSMS
jgi:hypothetical protein